MTKKAMEKQALVNFSAWDRSRDTELYHVYGRFSPAKIAAWEYCKKLCFNNSGYNLRVVNHNTFIFTAGFEFIDPETGVVKFMYITPNYDIAIDMPCNY